MKNTPALVVQTKLNHDGSVDANVVPKLKVTYKFDISSARKLKLPYAVSINGAVPKKFRDTAQKIDCNSGEIEIYASPGDRVELFLNSDAHPLYRSNPVYRITLTDYDVLIKIIERSGKNSETDELKGCGDKTIGNKKTTLYEAALTGDIWMKISHKYTTTEVDTLISGSFSPLIVENVKKIYDNLKQPFLNITVPSQDANSGQRCISISFKDSENARDNIKNGYEFLSEGLTRAHPTGYAAIFNAALTTGINKVRMTSTWRPMKGSIAHRAGLGLDVDFVGSTQLNRQELRDRSKNTENVSEEEIKFFAAFESAKNKQIEAQKEVYKARTEAQLASGNNASLIDAKRRLDEATKVADEADAARKSAEAIWVAERDRTEPDEIKRFRRALITSPSISQLFDPWVVDSDTSDKQAAQSNTQTDDNEKLHAHHLHITVKEPKIL
jgi:hypothetical protein